MSHKKNSAVTLDGVATTTAGVAAAAAGFACSGNGAAVAAAGAAGAAGAEFRAATGGGRFRAGGGAFRAGGAFGGAFAAAFAALFAVFALVAGVFSFAAPVAQATTLRGALAITKTADGGNPVSGTDYSFTDSSASSDGVLTIKSSTPVTLTTGGTQVVAVRFQVAAGVNAVVTLNNMSTRQAFSGSYWIVPTNSSLTLKLQGTNLVTFGNIILEGNASLTVTSAAGEGQTTGTLTLPGNIESGSANTSVTIKGGTLKLDGSYSNETTSIAYYIQSNTINITGGSVFANIERYGSFNADGTLPGTLKVSGGSLQGTPKNQLGRDWVLAR
jgi:hypothetical protein